MFEAIFSNGKLGNALVCVAFKVTVSNESRAHINYPQPKRLKLR